MKSYLIRVRLRENVYDTYTYNANSLDDAKEMMRERIWFEYKCNPEIISVMEV